MFLYIFLCLAEVIPDTLNFLLRTIPRLNFALQYLMVKGRDETAVLCWITLFL